MSLTASEKIRVILTRRHLSISELSVLLNTSQSNISNKLKRNNLTENDIKQIAAALDCTYENNFIMNDTGEKI